MGEPPRNTRLRGDSSSPSRATPVVVLGPRPDAESTTRLCEEVRDRLRAGDGPLVVCDVGAVQAADIAVVDAVCRLQLAARREGGALRLRNASAELRDLLRLVGLDGVVPCDELGVEPRRQPEHREVAGGVEEEDDPADPSS
jgi:anti-anti-sigma regulatory factor